MKNKEQKAPLSAHELEKVQEAVKVLLEHKIGAHEFASLAGVAYRLPKEKLLLSTAEAAAAWGVTAPTVRRWVHKGWISPVEGCKGWKFKAEDGEEVASRRI